MKKLFINIVVGLFVIVSLDAATVTVGWSPNPETNILGYKIFYGTQSKTYTNSVTVTNVLQSMTVTPIGGINYTNIVIQSNVTQATISNLPLGVTNFFSIAAYNTFGQTGPLLTEINTLVTAPPPAPPSVVQNFRVLSVSPAN